MIIRNTSPVLGVGRRCPGSRERSIHIIIIILLSVLLLYMIIHTIFFLQVTKMCVWSLHQDDEFYDEKMNEIKYGGSIWNIVASFTNVYCFFENRRRLQMTPEQKKSILSMRTETNEPIDNMNKILQIIDKLQENVCVFCILERSIVQIKENFNISCEQLSSIMKILTPRQQTMFLLWCENNKGKNQLLSLLFSVLHKEDTNVCLIATRVTFQDDILSDSSDDNNDTVEL